MVDNISVLMITTGWPTLESPNAVPFVVRQVEFLRRAGVHVDVISFRGAKNPVNYLNAWRRVGRQLARNPYDLIHAQWGQSAIAALPKRLPLVVTFRGIDLEGIVGKNGGYTVSGRILKAISKQVARWADQLIVVAERMARHLPARPYHVIPSGIDLELFRPVPTLEARQLLGLPKNKSLILFAADPEHPRKRHHLAREAVARLKGQSEVELVVSHDVPHTLMPYYMSACDVLLLTSLHEGSPNVVKEALACDLPVVSLNVGDVDERIGPVEGCVVCTDDHAETIAAGLDYVLARDQRIDGRSAVQDLDETLLTKRIIEVYQMARSNS